MILSTKNAFINSPKSENNPVLIPKTKNEEPATIKMMDEYALLKGYEVDFSASRLHHEIYLSDPRKVSGEKLRTVIRHPVRKIK